MPEWLDGLIKVIALVFSAYAVMAAVAAKRSALAAEAQAKAALQQAEAAARSARVDEQQLAILLAEKAEAKIAAAHAIKRQLNELAREQAALFQLGLSAAGFAYRKEVERKVSQIHGDLQEAAAVLPAVLRNQLIAHLKERSIRPAKTDKMIELIDQHIEELAK